MIIYGNYIFFYSLLECVRPLHVLFGLRSLLLYRYDTVVVFNINFKTFVNHNNCLMGMTVCLSIVVEKISVQVKTCIFHV